MRGEQRQEDLPHAAERDGNSQQESQRGHQVSLRDHVGLRLQTKTDTGSILHLLLREQIYVERDAPFPPQGQKNEENFTRGVECTCQLRIWRIRTTNQQQLTNWEFYKFH